MIGATKRLTCWSTGARQYQRPNANSWFDYRSCFARFIRQELWSIWGTSALPLVRSIYPSIPASMAPDVTRCITQKHLRRYQDRRRRRRRWKRERRRGERGRQRRVWRSQRWRWRRL